MFTRFNRRRTLLALSIACGTFAAYAPAQANEFPNGPIRIIVPYTAGATNDAIPRIIGPKLAELLGVPVIVENRPGAGGDIGVKYVIDAKPDGQVLLMASNAVITRQATAARPAYDTLRDLRPVILVGDQPMVLVVAQNFKANSVEELIKIARQKPESVSYATPGAGTPHQLASELLSSQAKVRLLHIPYKGTAASLVDTAAERVTMTWATPASGRAMLESGKVKPLGVTAGARLKSMPDVKTLKESGIDGLTSGFWYGFMAPKGTPEDVVQKIYSAMRTAIDDPAVADQLRGLTLELTPMDPKQFEELVDRDLKQWQQVAKSANISVEE